MKEKKEVMSTFMRDSEGLSMGSLSLALIGPDVRRRREVAKAFEGQQATI